MVEKFLQLCIIFFPDCDGIGPKQLLHCLDARVRNKSLHRTLTESLSTRHTETEIGKSKIQWGCPIIASLFLRRAHPLYFPKSAALFSKSKIRIAHRLYFQRLYFANFASHFQGPKQGSHTGFILQIWPPHFKTQNKARPSSLFSPPFFVYGEESRYLIF